MMNKIRFIWYRQVQYFLATACKANRALCDHFAVIDAYIYIYICLFVYLVRKHLPNPLLLPEFSSHLNADFLNTFLETLWFQGVLI